MEFEGEHKIIPIKGISRAGADSLCEDGAMNEVIGLEKRDGSFVPYSPEITSEEFDSAVYVNMGDSISAVYIHAVTSGSKNRLILTSKKGLYFCNKGETPQKLDVNNVKDVSFVGNIACISTESGIVYFLFNTTTQKYQLRFDTYEDLPEISLLADCVDKEHPMTAGDMSGCLAIVKSEDSGSIESAAYNINGSNRTVLTYNLDIYFSILQNLANKAQYLLGQLGRIHGYCLAVTAYRLTTGEYVWASSPILIGKPAITNTDGDSDKEYVPKDLLYYYTWKDGVEDREAMMFKNISTSQSSGDSAVGTSTAGVYLTNSLVVAAKYNATSTTNGWFDSNYNTSGSYYEYGLATIPPMFGWFHNTMYNGGSFAIAAVGNTLHYKIDKDIAEKYNGVIDAACIFISEIINPYEFTDITIKSVYDKVNGFFKMGMSSKQTTGYKFISKDADRLQREITNLRNFYKIAEIPFKDIKATEEDEGIYIDLNGVLGDNLYLQETLPVSAFDRKRVIDTNMFVYNSRLHLYNYTEKLNTSSILQNQIGGLGQWYGIELNNLVAGRISLNTPEHTTITFATDNKLALNPFISYPDRRAYKLELFFLDVQDNNVYEIGVVGTYVEQVKKEFLDSLLAGEEISINALKIKWAKQNVSVSVNIDTYDLTPSQNGGFAMYLGVETYTEDDTEKKRLYRYIAQKTTRGSTLAFIPEVNSDTITYNRNKLKVSETSTPYVFPYEETHKIGSGYILGLAVQTSIEAQYNYGKYPLLAFCSDGIYSMSVNESGSGAYSTNFQSALDVCTNANTICSIGNGTVLFASNKGLMAVTPNGVVEVFPQLIGKPHPLPQNDETKFGMGMVLYTKLLTHSLVAGFTSSLNEISKEDFFEFLKDTGTHVSYLYDKSLVLVYNKLYSFAYAIDMEFSYATKFPVKIYFEDNDVSDKKFYLSPYTVSFRYARFTKYGSRELQHTVFQTRPIKITSGLKSYIRVLLRGYFKRADADGDNYYATLLVLGSIDCECWQPIGYTEKYIGEGIHDIGCVTDRVSCNYIMIIFCAQLEDGCHLDKIELSSNSKYNNKLR